MNVRKRASYSIKNINNKKYARKPALSQVCLLAPLQCNEHSPLSLYLTNAAMGASSPSTRRKNSAEGGAEETQATAACAHVSPTLSSGRVILKVPHINFIVIIIESVGSINRDERGFPLTQYIINGRISRARNTITHFKHHHHVLRLVSNRMGV